ncbi:MAG: BatA domain-containing protein [Planctomycetes bacterium]|nr:BatA domain-containing protein [Planctomycetota bacterium]
MSFAVPAALWGLLAVGLPLLISFWRLRPTSVVVPSVALWRELPDRVPPVRALRSPRLSAIVMAQMAAVACVVAALAGPFAEFEAAKPRTVAIVIDLSARMYPRLAEAREAYERIRGALGREDRLVVYTFPPPARNRLVWEVAPFSGDATVALELAAREADLVFFLGDRPVDAPCEQVLVGGSFANTGVIDANVDGDKVWIRTVSPEGERVTPHDPQPEIRVAEDGFPLDDVLFLDSSARPVEVALEGRPHAGVRRVLERLEGVRLVKGGHPSIVVRVGEAGRVDDPPVRVIIDPPETGAAIDSDAIAFVPHPLFESVRAEEFPLEGAREVRGGSALALVGGRPVMALFDRELVIGGTFPSGPWPPSLVIFWSNVIEFLAGGRTRQWTARRTDRTLELEGGRVVQPRRVGRNEFFGEVVHANLLDREASDLSGQRRAFDASRLSAAPVERRRRDLSVWPACVALVLMSLSWWLERKAF